MRSRRWRFGIRPQLTFIVLLAAVLSTVATLVVTETAVQSYVQNQAQAQEQQHMKIAKLVLSTNFGQNVSIGSDGNMVVDSPGSNGSFRTYDPNAPYGKYRLNNDTDFVDLVQQLINGMVAVYQCTDKSGDTLMDHGTPTCLRISGTFLTRGSATSSLPQRQVGVPLDAVAIQRMHLTSAPVEGDTQHWQWTGEPRDWSSATDQVVVDGTRYVPDYAPILNPQGQMIGVLFVGVPYDAVTSVVASTTIELVIIGTIIMVAGVVVAIFVASAIVGTLQRAARQVSTASERFGAIAAQQASGSTQQVWAINAINQALQNLSETTTDISRRTDQLAQMGSQVLQRRADISPTQVDSIMAYITRSVRDISTASRQQASTYQRMSGAMQAVMEVAEQVAGDSQQTNENAGRLEQVVQQLRQLVGVNPRFLRSGAAGTAPRLPEEARPASGRGARARAAAAARAAGSNPLEGSKPMTAGPGTPGRLGGPAAVSGGGMGMRRGGRPVGAAAMPGVAGPSGELRAGMPLPSQSNWMLPTVGAGAPGAAPPPRYAGRAPMGQLPNGPMAGAQPGGAWGMPARNSGPNLAPWMRPADPYAPQPPSAAGFAAGFGPNSGPGRPEQRPSWAPPAMPEMPQAGEAGDESMFPWTRRE